MLNLAYWYVPAALTTRRSSASRIDSGWILRGGRGRSPLMRAAALGFSALHFGVPVRRSALMLWPDMISSRRYNWLTFGQRMFLTNIDWALMTYSAIVGLSHALGVPPRVAGTRA